MIHSCLHGSIVDSLLKHYYIKINKWFFIPLENISLIWKRHHCRGRAAKFDPHGCLEVEVYERATYTVTLNTHGIDPCCPTFVIGAVTACVYILSL